MPLGTLGTLGTLARKRRFHNWITGLDPFAPAHSRAILEIMTDNLQHSIKEIDKDLAPSWIELSNRVRDLAAALKLKAAGTVLAADADHLAQETSQLCGHVERLHADVIDLVGKLEAQIPTPEPDAQPIPLKPEEVDQGYNRIQRENHELRADFKDVLKALFLWRDDPNDRARDGK